MKSDFIGYPLDCGEIDVLIADIRRQVETDRRQCSWLACLNPHSYVVAQEDKDFRSALMGCTYLVPDGIGVVIAGRFLGLKIHRRITGFDVFLSVMEMLNEIGGSVFFLGSSDECLQAIESRVHRDFPRVVFAGSYSPPFKTEFDERDLDEITAPILRAEPDVLWIGLTAPKQEILLSQLSTDFPVSFAGAIGAVFDFYGGKVKRPHVVFQRLGLEWLPRLLREPTRLWRRTLVSAPKFVWYVLNERLRRGEMRR